MKVALVHDWLVTHRGGENVLLEIARLFPEAPIYTLVYSPKYVHPELSAHPIKSSFIQKLPGCPKHFRTYLPLFPKAIESFDLSAYDLLISTSHCVAKGINTHTRQRHIAYIHTPMRYIWDQFSQYIPNTWPGSHLLLKPAGRIMATFLRRWDIKSAQRPNILVANSHYVAARIRRVWHRSAQVIYPPVRVDFFRQIPDVSVEREGYLVVSALVPYKRVDLAVQLASQNKLPLTVIGDGPERSRLQNIAAPHIRFVPQASSVEIREAYRKARALLFCGVEDFGIVPVEAMAAGCPVIALRAGGVCETVVTSGENITGVFFEKSTVASMEKAVAQFEDLWSQTTFHPERLQKHASRFDTHHFLTSLKELVL